MRVRKDILDVWQESRGPHEQHKRCIYCGKTDVMLRFCGNPNLHFRVRCLDCLEQWRLQLELPWNRIQLGA
jgi:hypothetical protein